MATTGFWPVKDSLKDVVKYAENPDKTTNPKYLDDDLAAALMLHRQARKSVPYGSLSLIRVKGFHQQFLMDI